VGGGVVGPVPPSGVVPEFDPVVVVVDDTAVEDKKGKPPSSPLPPSSPQPTRAKGRKVNIETRASAHNELVMVWLVRGVHSLIMQEEQLVKGFLHPQAQLVKGFCFHLAA